MAFNFSTQLKVGKSAEETFKAKFPELVKLDGRGPDFELNGVFIELKTDTYDRHKTGNIFAERWSSYDDNKPGGPFQALEKGSTVFCYFFSNNQDLFIFNTAELVKELEKHEDEYKSRMIQNRGWQTMGYLVPLKSLEHIYKLYKMEDELDIGIFKV